MIDRRFDDINAVDVQNLVANAVQESRTLEYKQELPGRADQDRKEFMADVSALANAAGGDLLYGITERDGVAHEAHGFEALDVDAEILRLEAMIRDGIQPRIPRVQIRAIEGLDLGPVIIIRVPQSWAGPQMVTFNNVSRFYARNAAGKYQLDVTEIRSAFLSSDTRTIKIKRLREERLTIITSRNTPVDLGDGPVLALHLIPIGTIDTSDLQICSAAANDYQMLQPLNGQISNYRHNLDGLLVYSQSNRQAPFESYTQVFRNGVLEAVDGRLLRESAVDGQSIISMRLERRLIETLHRYFGALQHLEIPSPVVVMMTLLGVRGFSIAPREDRAFDNPQHTIDRDVLLLPDVLIQELPVDEPDVAVRPILDALWQAAGWPACMNYDANGRHALANRE